MTSEELVLEAIRQLGPDAGAVEVGRLANKLARAIRPRSLCMRMAESERIPATFEGMDYEESSKRWVISYVADKPLNEKSPVETVRTDRTDDERKEAFVHGFLQHLNPGDRIIVYKCNEEVNDATKRYDHVRVAPYIERVEPKE